MRAVTAALGATNFEAERVAPAAAKEEGADVGALRELWPTAGAEATVARIASVMLEAPAAVVAADITAAVEVVAARSFPPVVEAAADRHTLSPAPAAFTCGKAGKAQPVTGSSYCVGSERALRVKAKRTATEAGPS